jgi:hypothetical protein
LIISTNFGSTLPPVGEYWCNASSEVSIKANAPDVASEEKYSFDRGWLGTGLGSYTGTENPHNMTIAGPVNETAVWQHQYLVTVFSADGSQITTKNYTEVGTTINMSVNSPLPPDYNDVRKVCVGWNGTGSAPASGTSLTVTFVLNEPSSLAWNWQTQYLLDVLTEPAGLTPQPTISPPGDWHESGANVTLLAQHANDYDFDHWTVDGVNWDVGVNAINITFNEPHEAIARYVHARAWWETLFRPDVAQAVLGLVGTVLTVALIGTAWVRSRKRRNVVKTFLNEISDVFSRFKADPPRCEEELSRLRNTILEGFTGGRISEDNYNVLDKKIDECVKELQRQRDREAKGS